MGWYDAGMPVINDPDVLCTAELIRRLYAMPGCDLGGPLHAMLDDGNIDDEQLASDYYERHEGQQIEHYLQKYRWQSPQGYVFTDELSCTPEVADLCRLIMASFRRMPESWRAAAIAWFDGTIAQNLPILVDNPEAACKASDEQVEGLIAELRQWIEQGETPAPMQCVPIPCPPFTPVTPTGASLQGIERVRYEQTIHAPGIQVTKLDERGNPIGEPRQVSGWADARIKTNDEPTPDAPKLRWVETTVRFPPGMIDPGLWSILHSAEQPKIDMEQAREQPPQVEMPKAWVETVEWALPTMVQVDPDKMPIFVQLPPDTANDTMQAAIELCRRAGLLDTPNGYVLLPAELDAGGLHFPILGNDTP